MFRTLRRVERVLFEQMFHRPPAGRLGARTFRFFLLTAVFALLAGVLPRGIGSLCRVFAWICFTGLAVCMMAYLFRWVFSRILWTVRSRLIVTCLLMGLAPIILFGTLASIAAYIFCGQFATSIALEGIHDSVDQIQERSAAVLASVTQGGFPARSGLAQQSPADLGPLEVSVWNDDKLVPRQAGKAASAADASPFETAARPAWLHSGFAGVVAASGKLFLCGDSARQASGHGLEVLACSPFRDQEVATLAEGLGTLRIMPNFDLRVSNNSDDDDDAAAKKTQDYEWLRAGTLAAPVNLFDVRVFFSAPVATTDWVTGGSVPDRLLVTSRPSVLYRRLFESSVETGRYMNIALIAISILFGALELLACAIAIVVSRTVTRSIADLYDATRMIDRGDLEHRIPVRRKDQLGALAASFNSMTASLRELLKEQREKDRMQNELKIAQEVQNNLFPHTPIRIPGLDLFGICESARTIGGDYYDFIPFGGSQVYIALGDISGKGISAALLMASLHSAVRAYRSGAAASNGDATAGISPGRLLALLNHHLYTSTQPSKYATLFLASFDPATRRLTYANGGHLPPLVLCANGEMQRLECGGSVVGLLDGLKYQEATVQLSPGDLLVAYSDGLTEPEKDQVDFGEAGLIDVIRRNQILGLSDIGFQTLRAVRAWIGDEEQPDDMTLVLARLS